MKHSIKLKTSPARLAQLLQPSLAFGFSLQPMTAHWTSKFTTEMPYNVLITSEPIEKCIMHNFQ